MLFSILAHSVLFFSLFWPVVYSVFFFFLFWPIEYSLFPAEWRRRFWNVEPENTVEDMEYLMSNRGACEFLMHEGKRGREGLRGGVGWLVATGGGWWRIW